MLKIVDKFNTPYMAVETKQPPDVSKSRPIYSRIDNEYTTFYISPDGLHNVFSYHGKWFLMTPFSQGMELIRYLASPRRMGNFYTGAPARRSRWAWDFRIDCLCSKTDLWDDFAYRVMFDTIVDEAQACRFSLENKVLLISWFAKIRRPGKRKILAHEQFPLTEDDSCFQQFFEYLWKADRPRLWKITFEALPKQMQKNFLTEKFWLYETAKKEIQARHTAFWKTFQCPIGAEAPPQPLPPFCQNCSKRLKKGDNTVCLLEYARLRGAAVNFPISSLLGNRRTRAF